MLSTSSVEVGPPTRGHPMWIDDDTRKSDESVPYPYLSSRTRKEQFHEEVQGSPVRGRSRPGPCDRDECATAIGWGVDWSPTSNQVLMGTGASMMPTFINFSNPGFQSFTLATSQTTASNLTLDTHETSGSPLVVPQINAQNFTITAKVYDGTTTGAPFKTVSFTGNLWGTFSTGGVSTFSSWNGPTSQMITFAGTGDKFTVALVGLQGPPIPSLSAHPGQILAQITETPGSGGGPHGTPEPSTMLMGCMGLSFLGFASWRKRNRQAA